MKFYAALTLFVLCSVCQEAWLADPFYEGENWVVQGTPFTLVCRIPMQEPLALRWTKDNVTIDFVLENGYEVMDDFDEVNAYLMSIISVRSARLWHGGFYRCNEFSARGHQVIVIADTMEEKIVRIQGKSPLVFNCNLTQAGQVKWMKDGEPVVTKEGIEISGQDLKILNPSVSDIATYTCQVDVPGAAARSQAFKVTADVQLKNLRKSVNVVEGDDFRIECEVAVGEPKPEIKWMKGDEILTVGNNDSHIALDSAHEYKNNVLIVRKVVMEDRAEYTCIGENSFSSDNSTVLLRVKDKYAALWPFLGIVAEVVVLCIIIFIYERRRSKAEFDESDNEQNETKNAADNAKGGELRHRK